MGLLAQLAPLELQVLRDSMAFQELKVKMVIWDSKVLLDPLVNLESLVSQAPKGGMEGLGPQDLKALRETREIQDQVDPQVPLAMMENMVKGDLQGPRERKESLASKEDQEREDPLVLKGPREILEHLASLAIRESKVQVASRENLETLETMEGRETEASRATQGLPASLVCKGLLVNLACLDLLASRAMLDHQAPRETLALLDLLAYKVLLVTKDLLVMKAPLA